MGTTRRPGACWRRLEQVLLLLPLVALMSGTASAADYFGAPVGRFQNRAHDIQGEVRQRDY